MCEDSLPISQLLVELINNVSGEAKLLVVGVAGNGSEAVEMALRLRPDVIAMDVRMPILNGLEATRRIMEEQPTPIVLVSEVAETDVALSMEALAVGALMVIPKPHGPSHPAFQADAIKLRETLALMAEVKVVRHWRPNSPKPALDRYTASKISYSLAVGHPQTRFNEQQRLVAIGSSTGGPSALSNILRNLPSYFNWPILITQHIMPGFDTGLAQWLTQATNRKVVVAEENMAVEVDSGQIILAPGVFHLRINADQKLSFDRNGPVKGILPSVDTMFESIAQNIDCTGVVGVLLTGMGRDGAAGLKLLLDNGATTIVQDEVTSVVFGMPKEAIAIGAAQKVLPLLKIPEQLTKLHQGLT